VQTEEILRYEQYNERHGARSLGDSDARMDEDDW